MVCCYDADNDFMHYYDANQLQNSRQLILNFVMYTNLNVFFVHFKRITIIQVWLVQKQLKKQNLCGWI